MSIVIKKNEKLIYLEEDSGMIISAFNSILRQIIWLLNYHKQLH